MSSTASVVLSAFLGLLGGTAGGAVLTGWFSIRQQQLRRVQKRRADTYMEMLAWVRWRTTMLAPPPATSGPPAAGVDDPGTELGGSTTKPQDPSTKGAFAYTDATNSDGTGPDSRYFVTLRAHIIAFGSHDMARAFDRWTEAYRMVLGGHGDDGCSLDPKVKKVLRKLKYMTAIFPDNTRPGTGNPSRRGDRGFPDGDPGCLTRALECCASHELRRG
jgi:hypothetical protein